MYQSIGEVSCFFDQNSNHVIKQDSREIICVDYLAHVIEPPNLRIPNPQYLQLDFCFDFLNDSENTF